MGPKTNDVAKTLRNFSASEIAQDPRKFDIWVTHHRCQTVGYSDIPKAYKADVKQVFKFERRLPMSLLTDPDLWTNATEVKEFLQRAHNKAPHLFSSSLELDAEHMDRLLGEMRFVHAAWKALRSRSKTGDPPWSEKDFAVNVYDRIRFRRNGRGSVYRAGCHIALPQPIKQFAPESVRYLAASSVEPDWTLFVPRSILEELSQAADSPYKVLERTLHDTISFASRTTPLTTLPDPPGFVFAGAFFEDKKDKQAFGWQDAYRQNRMATTSALRQMQALNVKSPIFGILWTAGEVRAHADWWILTADKQYNFYSCLYPGPKGKTRRDFKWKLKMPEDILQVYLLVENLEHWTSEQFQECISRDIHSLREDVVGRGRSIIPWKRIGNLNEHPLLSGTKRGASPDARRSPKRRKKSR